jgi:hypothetical protein
MRRGANTLIPMIWFGAYLPTWLKPNKHFRL